MIIEYHLYKLFDLPLTDLPTEIQLLDHIMGFDQHGHNQILDKLNEYSQSKGITTSVCYHQILDPEIKSRYVNLDIKFSLKEVQHSIWQPFTTYHQHPDIAYKNFICSFNGSDHISRKLLTAILQRFGHYTPEYCSKNFVFTVDQLDGYLQDYVPDQDNFYRKFFIADNSEDFFQTINSFGHVRFEHAQNIYNLETKLTESFLHIVSETLATSYYPFVTEKFLYSVVTRGLFLAYAQPGWHSHLDQYYGFKKYTKLFDYKFDSIKNPVERLLELITMISKFSSLSTADWTDLYEMESDTIEYNYDHYFSGDYLKCLKKYEQ